MLSSWRVNLADQSKQQPQEMKIYMTSQYKTNLWSTHVNIVRLAEPIRYGFQNRGVCLQAFPSFLSPFLPPGFLLFHFLGLA